MDKRIRLDQVKAASLSSRHLLTVSGMMVHYNWHLPFASYLLSNASLCLVLFVYSLYHYSNSIDKLAVVTYHMSLLVTIFTGTIIGILWKDRFVNLFEETYWSYNYGSAIMLEKLREIKDECATTIKKFFRFTFWAMLYTDVNFLVLAYCESYLHNDNRQLIFPCWFPFELDSIFVYIAVLIWEEIILCHLTFMAFATLLLALYFHTHIKSEFDLLQYALRKINERTYELARNSEDYRENKTNCINIEILRRCYIICTTSCAEHHANIVRYFNLGMKLLDFLYFMIFITELIVCTCTGFALISDNIMLKLKFMGLTVVQLVYFYVACWVSESIAEESMTISDLIYAMKWYTFPKQCQTTLMLMMTRSTQPLRIKLLTGQVVDFVGFMSLVRASYSYFNMMLATTE